MSNNRPMKLILFRARSAIRACRTTPALQGALLGVMAAFAAMLVVIPPAVGLSAVLHIGLRSSVPAKDAHLTTAPTEIRLTFTGIIDVSKASVELVAAENKPIALDSLRAVPDSNRVAVAKIVAPLPGGTYTVRWKAIAADGAAGSGAFNFMYMAPAPKQNDKTP